MEHSYFSTPGKRPRYPSLVLTSASPSSACKLNDLCLQESTRTAVVPPLSKNYAPNRIVPTSTTTTTTLQQRNSTVTTPQGSGVVLAQQQPPPPNSPYKKRPRRRSEEQPHEVLLRPPTIASTTTTSPQRSFTSHAAARRTALLFSNRERPTSPLSPPAASTTTTYNHGMKVDACSTPNDFIILEDDDDDCIVLDAPKTLLRTAAATPLTLSSRSQNDDGTVIQESSNVQLPHKRMDCGVYPWNNHCTNEAQGIQRLFCDKCYCCVCHVPVKDCRHWESHHYAMQHEEDPIVSKKSTAALQEVLQLNEEFWNDFMSDSNNNNPSIVLENGNTTMKDMMQQGDCNNSDLIDCTDDCNVVNRHNNQDHTDAHDIMKGQDKNNSCLQSSPSRHYRSNEEKNLVHVQEGNGMMDGTGYQYSNVDDSKRIADDDDDDDVGHADNMFRRNDKILDSPHTHDNRYQNTAAAQEVLQLNEEFWNDFMSDSNNNTPNHILENGNTTMNNTMQQRDSNNSDSIARTEDDNVGKNYNDEDHTDAHDIIKVESNDNSSLQPLPSLDYPKNEDGNLFHVEEGNDMTEDTGYQYSNVDDYDDVGRGYRMVSRNYSRTMANPRTNDSRYQKKIVGNQHSTKKIKEVLAENLFQLVCRGGLSDFKRQPTNVIQRTTIDKLDMDGDIPQLKLYNSFFVEAVRIGWHFPVVLPPQRQMANHIIKALKRKLHVVLESPTGTGKSAAILCAVLGWQRYHAKHILDRTHFLPKIIYCSRTHSQISQMVASLQKTPYRPRIAVLGSRSKACINRNVIGSGTNQQRNPAEINKACQALVQTTDFLRSQVWEKVYDDNNPQCYDHDRQGAICPHYQQLSTARTATMLQSKFILDRNDVNCCSVGGEKTKLGVHDMEDLVAFANNPYVAKNVAVYRKRGSLSYGISVQGGREQGVVIDKIEKGGGAESCRSLTEGDQILAVNGKSVQTCSAAQVTAAIDNVASDRVDVDVLKCGGDYPFLDSDGEDEGSPHSACPYYMSRALARHADIIFAPYNYVLDPVIRAAVNISLEGNVVVLDEAHNVEDSLTEIGSAKFGEIELCQLLTWLARHSSTPKAKSVEVSELSMKLCEAAHRLLLFVEAFVLHMRSLREQFENSTGNDGAQMAIEDWKKFDLPDDHNIEVSYYGPDGNVTSCNDFFQLLSMCQTARETLLPFVQVLKDKLKGDFAWKMLDFLGSLIEKMALASTKRENFYFSFVIQPNGNFRFAAGENGNVRGRRQNSGQRKTQPKALSNIHRRMAKGKKLPLEPCQHEECQHSQQRTFHGDFCNGEIPKWETHLVLKLLNPAVLMKDLSDKCRTVVLASGSLSPISSFCAELGLEGEASHRESKPSVQSSCLLRTSIPQAPPCLGRLQVEPRPLEANHVIDLAKQLFAVSIGNFPDGTSLTVNFSQYHNNMTFYAKLGRAIASVLKAIPRGGVLVFMPSYSFLSTCIQCWQNMKHNPEIWESFVRSKKRVIVEPTGSQEEFEKAKENYQDTIRQEGSCLLLAVFRGKMSEGISFNDDNARCVICVGLPYPKKADRAVKSKIAYNDVQRKTNKKTSILSGQEWYSQQAYRAIAQALGRCIRHGADYGVVVLMDSRHCDDGSPSSGLCRAHRNLPKWMRHSVRTLSMESWGVGEKPVLGGYDGLARALEEFFVQAPIHCRSVSEKWKEDLGAAHDRQNISV